MPQLTSRSEQNRFYYKCGASWKWVRASEVTETLLLVARLLEVRPSYLHEEQCARTECNRSNYHPTSGNHTFAPQPQMAPRVVRAELYDTTPPLPAQMRGADRIVCRVPTEARSGSRAIPFTIVGREPPNSRQLIADRC